MSAALRTLASYAGTAAEREMRSRGWAQTVVVAGFVLLGCAVAVGMEMFFSRAFGVLLADAIAGPIIARFMIEATFAGVFFLGVASFVSAAPSSLFRPSPSAIIDAAPVNPVSFFLARFFPTAALSMWPVLLVGAPSITALALRTAAGVPYAALAAVSLLLFAVAIPVAGALVSFAFMPLLQRFGRKSVPLVSLLLALLIGVVFFKTVVPNRPFALFVAATPNQAVAAAATMAASFGKSPSHVFAQAVATPIALGPGASVAISGLFAAAAMIAAALVAVLLMAAAWYPALIASAREFRAPASGIGQRPPRRFPAFLTWRHGFLFEKTWLELSRDDRALGQLALTAAMIGLSVVLIAAVARTGFGTADVRRLTDASIAMIGFFSVLLALRFAFPAITLERARGWVVTASPLHFHEVFSWQLFFWSALHAVIAVIAAVSVAAALGFAAIDAVWFTSCAAIVAVTVTTICLGHGTIFPAPRAEDPQTLSTSPSGLAATIVCGAYLWIAAGYVRDIVTIHAMVPVFGFFIVSVAAAGAYWFLGVRASEKELSA